MRKWSLFTYQHCRPARAKVVVLLVLALVLTVPAGVARGDGTWRQVNVRTAEPVAAASVRSGEVPPLPGMFQCSGENPCQFPPGRYVLTLGEIIPGLRLTLPPGWSSHENDPGELNLTPDQSGNELLIWVDMAAVKSSGPGHGETVLTDVGQSPRALIKWLISNPDFNVVTGPRKARLGNIPMRTLSVNLSPSVNYGDPGCPGNPHCADFFTRPGFWGSNWFGIGGASEVRFYIGTIWISGQKHTMMVAVSGNNRHDLLMLERDAKPILHSLHLPRCHKHHPGC